MATRPLLAALALAAAWTLPGRAFADRFLEPPDAVSRVLELADARLALMPAVAAAKWRAHASMADPQRERAVIGRAVAAGAALGLEREPLRALFALQVRLAREFEERLAGHWAQAPRDAPPAEPDLAAELRPRLDALTTGLVTALYLARPALEADGFAARFAPLAATRLADSGWSAESRAALLAALGAVRASARPVPVLGRVAASGVLRIGTTGDYAPWSIDAGGTLSGADIGLAKAIAADLAVRPVFVRTSWPTLLEDLAAGRFDIAIGGVSVTPAREAAGSFSTAYAVGGKTILARCRDAAVYPSLDAVDRPGVRVIVNPGGTNQQFDLERLHRARLVVHPDNRTIFEEIRAGRADVMITDDVEVELEIHRRPDLCRTLAGTLTRAAKAVLMPRDAAFAARLDAALTAEIAAGRPARLLREYLQQASVDSAPPAP